MIVYLTSRPGSVVARSSVSTEPFQEEDLTEVARYLVPATVNWTGAAAASAALVVASTTLPFLVVVTPNGCAWITILYPGRADEPGSVSISRDPSEANWAPWRTTARGLVAEAAAAAAGTAVTTNAALSAAVSVTGRRARNRARGRDEPAGLFILPSAYGVSRPRSPRRAGGYAVQRYGTGMGSVRFCWMR